MAEPLAYYDEPDEFGTLPKPILCIAPPGWCPVEHGYDCCPMCDPPPPGADEKEGTA